MSQPEEKCPKHKISYRLRRNANTGELALACLLCDIEAHGGTDKDIADVAKRIAESSPQEEQ